MIHDRLAGPWSIRSVRGEAHVRQVRVVPVLVSKGVESQHSALGDGDENRHPAEGDIQDEHRLGTPANRTD